MTVSLAPSLQVRRNATLVRVRELPVVGELLVSVGQQVGADQVVATAQLPGDVHVLRLAEQLGVLAGQVKALLRIREGQEVTRDQLLCEHSALWGWVRHQVACPCDGSIEAYSEETAHLSIRERPRPIELHAHVPGKVVALEPGRSVSIETQASWVQGVFGIGGERRGVLRKLPIPPTQQVQLSDVPEDCSGQILFGGHSPSGAVLQCAAARGALGFVTGSIEDAALREYLGYEIGIAVTGDEPVSMTLIVTEGFGKLEISQRVLEVLSPLEGQRCSINGATQVRAGAVRPEIIVVGSGLEGMAQDEALKGLVIGAEIRLIRFPHFGKRARVVELPEALERLATGAEARVLRATLADGSMVTVPRANIELV